MPRRAALAVAAVAALAATAFLLHDSPTLTSALAGGRAAAAAAAAAAAGAASWAAAAPAPPAAWLLADEEEERPPGEDYEGGDEDYSGAAPGAAAAAAALAAPPPSAPPPPPPAGTPSWAANAARAPVQDNSVFRQFGNLQDVPPAQALSELAACASIPCLVTAVDRLQGRSRFALPAFFVAGFERAGAEALGAWLRGQRGVLSGGAFAAADLGGYGNDDDDGKGEGGKRGGDYDYDYDYADAAPPGAYTPPRYFTRCCPADGAPCPADFAARAGCGARSAAHYVSGHLRAAEAAAGGLRKAVGEYSVDYAAAGEPLAARLYRLFPWVKVVLVLREPLARAAEAFVAPARGTAGEGELAAGARARGACDPGRESFFECARRALGPANLSAPLGAWLTTFPPGQVYAIQWEAVAEDRHRELAALVDFLGLRVNPRARVRTLKETAAEAAAAGAAPGPPWRFAPVGAALRAVGGAPPAAISIEGADSQAARAAAEEAASREVALTKPQLDALLKAARAEALEVGRALAAAGAGDAVAWYLRWEAGRRRALAAARCVGETCRLRLAPGAWPGA